MTSSFCSALSFTDTAINHHFWVYLSYGQSTRLLKDHGIFVSNNWTETGQCPLIQLPYVSASCLSWNAAPFSASPMSCLSFPVLGSMTSTSLSGELAAILSLISVCLSTSQGGFCSIVRRKHWSIEHICPFFCGNGQWSFKRYPKYER